MARSLRRFSINLVDICCWCSGYPQQTGNGERDRIMTAEAEKRGRKKNGETYVFCDEGKGNRRVRRHGTFFVSQRTEQEAAAAAYSTEWWQMMVEGGEAKRRRRRGVDVDLSLDTMASIICLA